MGKTLTWLFPLLLEYIHVLEEFTARHVHHPHVTVGCHNVLQQFDIFVVLLASQYTTRFDVLKGYLLSSVDNLNSKIPELIANETSLKKSYMLALSIEHTYKRWRCLFASKKSIGDAAVVWAGMQRPEVSEEDDFAGGCES